MCDMADPIEFVHDTYKYRMQWRLIADDPARYELAVTAGLPGEEPHHTGSVAINGFLLNAYVGNRKLREDITKLVRQAIEAGEIGQE